MNTDIIRKKGSFDPLGFEIILTDYGKTFDDIEDIIFSVKKNLSDADNSIFLKKKSTGGISASGTNIVTVAVTWGHSEYINFELEQTYKAGLFVKFKNDPVADENVEETFTIKIVQDYLQQN